MLFIVVASLLLARFTLQEPPYNFRPESRHVEVKEGESTEYVGFDQIGNQTIFGHCYIQSDSINVDYPILAPEETNETSLQGVNVRGFTPMNITRACAFVYDEVDEEMPLKWTLTAYDNLTEANVTEEVTIAVYYDLPLFLSVLTGFAGSSVANFYISGSTKLEKCSLSFNGTNVELDMNAVRAYDDDKVFHSRLTSLGGGRCGFKITDIAPSDASSLTLEATDDKNKRYKKKFTLVVVEPLDQDLQNRTVPVHLGDRVSVNCGKLNMPSANNPEKFCHLYNPEGALVSHEQICDYQLHIVTVSDLGTWRCSVGYDYSMEALEFTTDLVEESHESVTTFAENTTDFYVIGCQLVNYTISSLTFCKFTRPDGRIFKVTTGGVTANYNTFSTDLDNGKCSLEILKPLRNEDKGIWKCEASVVSRDGTSGGFITVESSRNFSYDTHTQRNVQLGKSFVVDCMVAYSSDHCYVIAPNGTFFEPQNRLQVSTGLCSFQVDEANFSDNGTWQCSIAQRNGIPDEILRVEISIIDFKVLFGDVEVPENEDAELVCNTNGIPLEYCMFISPSGLFYSLRKEDTDPDKISYIGRGLEYGDCGIKITNIERTDQGEWSCHISSKRSDTQESKPDDITKAIGLKIIPPPSPISIGDSFGIAVGVVAAIIIVGGALFYKYAKRSGDGIEAIADHSERHSESSNSGESVILAVGHSATYNTQNIN